MARECPYKGKGKCKDGGKGKGDGKGYGKGKSELGGQGWHTNGVYGTCIGWKGGYGS